ncbi:MAG: signal peptide peptidase SppA [Prevotella sp.]|nr:signal peptide peptidase SppA [Prevotella sp.]
MKDFFKYMLATMCGIIVLSILGAIIMVIVVLGIISGSEKSVKAKENSVFVLKLSGMVSERTEDNGPLTSLLGGVTNEMGLDDIVSAIQKAKVEENIKGIYIEGGVCTFDSPATAQQIRDALVDFKRSGKWVYAFGDQYLQASYYVCSAADSVYLNRTGMVDFRGLGGKSYYLKGLYDKLGVEYKVARVGRYKSYVESVTRTDMSADDSLQRATYLNGIWNHWADQMAKSRRVTVDQLNKTANDSIMLFASIDDYKQAGLIDRAMYPDEMKTIVRKKLGVKEDEEINQLTLDDMIHLKPAKKVKEKGDEVAIYYAYGSIIDELQSGLSVSHDIVGTQTVRDLQALADNKDVKAVVLRVNSGGGSAVASEQIWRAVNLLKKKKPVVVSMGGVAASGGYMISCGANYIFAEPTTITGSIGIFGLIPNFSGLVTQKLGVTWDGVQTHQYSDYDTNLIFGDENSQELQYMQAYVDRGYENFLGIVAQGRGMTKDQVHEIAQGRVWMATDALGIKLVDQLGSLNDAVKKAAQLAKMSEYHTKAYPEKEKWFSKLIDGEEDVPGTYLDGRLRQCLGELYEPLMQLRQEQQMGIMQARIPFSVTVK